MEHVLLLWNGANLDFEFDDDTTVRSVGKTPIRGRRRGADEKRR